MGRLVPLGLFLGLLLLFLSFSLAPVSGNGVFQVRHKFTGSRSRGAVAADMREHDRLRHRRILSGVDLPLGGSGLPTDSGLYYAQIGIGTPMKNYYVQVDTGSDILWVNCITCNRCPKKSDLGIELTLYDLSSSRSGSLVSCDESFCSMTYGDIPECRSNLPCQYSVLYGDGSSTTGYFVTDFLQYNQVSGDHQTAPTNASITFGCGAQQGGDLGSSSEAVDGILGFGQSNSSLLSQLAATGRTKKIFSHCLDTVNGGGIFAIGDVGQPKVKTTPLVPNMPHYNINLKSITVGGSSLQLPSDLFETGDRKGTIIDSGTTLAYLPEDAYRAVMNSVFANHQDLILHSVQDFLCFQYPDSLDDKFPVIVFHFENGLALNVYPHDYLFENQDKVYCVGFQNGGLQSKDGREVFLLGDLVFSNKLVVYDLENQTIGWTEYNCSSSIKIKDEKTGALYAVDAHNLSSGVRLECGDGTSGLVLSTVLGLLLLTFWV